MSIAADNAFMDILKCCLFLSLRRVFCSSPTQSPLNSQQSSQVRQEIKIPKQRSPIDSKMCRVRDYQYSCSHTVLRDMTLCDHGGPNGIPCSDLSTETEARSGRCPECTGSRSSGVWRPRTIYYINASISQLTEQRPTSFSWRKRRRSWIEHDQRTCFTSKWGKFGWSQWDAPLIW